jgi:hypothetical protein
VPVVEEEMPTLPEHPSSPPVFSGVRCKIFEVMTSTLPKGTLGSVASLLAAALYQGNPDRNHKLWNILSTERDILDMKVLHHPHSSQCFGTDIGYYIYIPY